MVISPGKPRNWIKKSLNCLITSQLSLRLEPCGFGDRGMPFVTAQTAVLARYLDTARYHWAFHSSSKADALHFW